MDLSTLSDDDLKALHGGDMSKVSDAGLKMIYGSGSETPSPAPQELPPGPVSPPSLMERIAKPVAGGLAVAGGLSTELGQGAAKFAKENPILTGLGAYALKDELTAGKDLAKRKAAEGANAIKNLALRGLQGGRDAVRAGVSTTRAISPQMLAGAGVPAAVTGAVAAPGAAMMYDAYKNYQQQSPDQRRESSMAALSGMAPGQAGMY